MRWLALAFSGMLLVGCGASTGTEDGTGDPAKFRDDLYQQCLDAGGSFEWQYDDSSWDYSYSCDLPQGEVQDPVDEGLS